jgi:phosphatidate phosphatase APP1
MANGHFRTLWHLSDQEFADLPRTGNIVGLTAVLARTDTRNFCGEIHVLDDRGLSVVSDIDDTIKISEVRDRHALLLNTFCRPFKPAPGMAELYRGLAAEDVQFHYVSASPWQLYPCLAEFIHENGFPPGTFHMKNFRMKDSSFWALFGDPIDYKLRILMPLIDQSPHRQFILIGDSGEKDPEVYGELARTYPEQVKAILIRNVSGEQSDSRRFIGAFRNVSESKWQLFEEPGEIRSEMLK